VSVDLVAASHLKLKDWSLAVALYKAVADEMRQSNEMKRALADDMEKRAHVVCNTIPLTIIITCFKVFPLCDGRCNLCVYFFYMTFPNNYLSFYEK
jgi:hypothetical protein